MILRNMLRSDKLKIISDLHIHSRFSRACSKQINVDNLEKWAKVKGVNLLGTGDFTHAEWFKELNEKLSEEDGILKTKSGFPFIWQTEISLMYTQDGKGRRIHFVILAPDRGVVEQITEFLGSKGRLDYDGRPIFGFSGIELVEKMMNISKDIEVIPAHIWTSWFGILGSKTGFDSFEECFKEKVKYIHALETGISSDPDMNRRVSSLDKFSILSFSDLHSFWPWRLGREATIFDCSLKYKDIIKCIRENKNLSTIEVQPEYGKYHWDGHRNCNVFINFKESKRLKGICPKCGKPLTIGVEYRVEELADRSIDYKSGVQFKSLIPLHELIAVVCGVKLLSSKKIWEIYNKLISVFGDEFNILLNASSEDLGKIVDSKLVDIILKNREGNLKIQPGADGVYGKLLLNGDVKVEKFENKQVGLDNF